MAVQQLQHAHGTTVVPSDTLYLFQSLGYPYRVSSALFVGVGGSVRVLTEGGDDVVFSSVPDGTFMPVHVVKVFATGTTASSIVAVDLSNLNPFDPDALAFFARVTTAGGSLSATEQTAIETLVVQMKADGIWSKMKAVYPMVGASAAACAQNLKSSSFTGTFTSGWTFSSSGIVSNGTSAYFDTSCRVVTDLNDLNSSWSYSGTANSWNGAFDGSRVVGFNAKSQIGLQNLSGITGTIPSSFKLMSGSVNSSSSNDAILYFDGVQQSAYTAASMSSDISFILGALNTGTFPTVNAIIFNVVNIKTLTLGSKLSGAEMADLYTAIDDFNTALSR